jgi:hypothetical protein
MSSNEPTINPTNNSNDSGLELAKISMRQAIIVALITTVGGVLTGYFASVGLRNKEEKPPAIAVVPDQKPVEVDELPKESNDDDYELIKDISIFDLRNWKYTPEEDKNTKYSAVNYTNYLHVKKLKPINFITAHYSTSGYGIDMRCITHPAPVFKKKEVPDAFHDKPNDKEYAIQIDVSKVEVGKEFLIVVEATYWNAFNDQNKNDASTYTGKEVKGMQELGLIVFFPDNKPFKEMEYYNTPENGEETPYLSNSTIFPDKNKKFIYWSIKERLPNNHYTLKWTW